MATLTGRKILIIDDDPDTVVFLCTWLEDQGYRVCSATDGKEGLTCLLRERPDLVLMDIKMPHCTGIQLYREMRNTSSLMDLPVIFVSGVSDYNLFSRDCSELSMPQACLDKPIDLERLRSVITGLFQ